MKNKRIFLLLSIFVIILFAFEVFALETVWPRAPLGTILTDSSSIVDVVRYFYEWGIVLGGIAAFISLVIAGIEYMASAGMPARIADAKDRMTSAVVGLILLLGIYLILNAINPELTVLRIPSFGVPTTTLGGISGYGPGSCASSTVYDNVRFGGHSYEIMPDECVDLWNTPLDKETLWWWIIPTAQKPSVKSAEISGQCTLRLFAEDPQGDCSDAEFLPVVGKEPDISKFGFGTAFNRAMLYTGCTDYASQSDCEENGCHWCAGDCIAGDCFAVAYADVDYKGKRLVIRGDIPDLSTSSINYNDIMSSIRVNPGVTLVLWEHANYTGASTTIAADTPNFCGFAGPHGSCGNCSIFLCNIVTGPFVDNWNDCVSSIDVQ